MPLVTKPFSNIITFTRASIGTFTGSNGLIQTATTNTPRFDYDPVTLAAKGLLIEEQRVNLLTWSESFRTQTLAVTGVSGTFVDGETVTATGGGTGIYVLAESTGSSFAIFNGSGTFTGTLTGGTSGATATISSSVANWTAVNATVTANTVVAPGGTLTGDKLVENTAASVGHKIESSALSTGIVSGISYTFSAYVKSAGRNWAVLEMQATLGGGFAWFDLSNGTVGTQVNLSGTSTITPVGNGWYRCSITDTSTGGGSAATKCAIFTANANSVVSYTGDGTSGIFIWGAQLEAGAFPTSYIPTVASQVTRSADVASVNTLSPWYNASEGTIYTETQTLPNNETSAYFFAIGNAATTNNYVLMRRNTGGEMRVQVSGIAVVGGVGGLPYTAGAVNKVIGAYKVDDAAFLSNGGAVQPDSSCPVPQGLDYAGIGQMPWGTALNGHIRNVAYYPRRLSNAELQALTA